ncbi:hypothetical protein SAMN06296058_1919 [Pseudoxanthomonas indica]|uniref:7-cyano-7-deazaguanine synthase (Queuosine biosynthesis) n=2 Tax=Pseudoxanthomonas indica TaxID=428993 RepID=A0A1T5KRF4_9GAMM|nr:hypothetical protein GCM10007235_23730 [Pseudoxanthomonas indica]SKC66075.1 hypothetical protein SAMN06296058_1919 [Pseudoxanthomonas indica]
MQSDMHVEADSPLFRDSSPRAVAVLWTGGWDSTFQVLRLLLKHRLPVVPYYLEDATRASTAVELATIQAISDALRREHEHVRGLLRPLRRFLVADIPRDPAMQQALREVRRRSYIGDQYAWLPAFCKRQRLDDIELSVHVDDKVQALLSSMVSDFQQAGCYRSYRVDARHADRPEYALFRYFSFPLFAIDKRAMQDEAAREGWSDYMHMTWFCHRPWRGQPCGACAPCVYAIEEGMAWRVPRQRRALTWLYRKFALPLKPPLRAALATMRRS